MDTARWLLAGSLVSALTVLGGLLALAVILNSETPDAWEDRGPQSPPHPYRPRPPPDASSTTVEYA